MYTIAASPLLSNPYDEAMMREATMDEDNGVKVGDCLVNLVRFVDDKAIIARSVKGYQELRDNINRVTEEYGKCRVRNQSYCLSIKEIELKVNYLS